MGIHEFSNYDLGIIWALGSNTDINRFSFRHKERYFLERLSPYFNNKIYHQNRTKKSDDMQYVLKVSGVDLQYLHDMGWTKRTADRRNLPELPDYRDFLRAYIEIHSSLDYSTRYSREKQRYKYRSLRLRIYGNVNLNESINRILAQEARCTFKSVQVLSNGKTSILNYTSAREIEDIFSYLHDTPSFEKFWEDVRHKLDNPILR